MKERLVQSRKELGLTQKEVANRLGFNSNYIAGLEQGRLPITDKFIRSYTREFRINDYWFRTGDGELFKPADREQEAAKLASILLNEPDGSMRYNLAKKVLLADQKYIDDYERFLKDLLGIK